VSKIGTDSGISTDISRKHEEGGDCGPITCSQCSYRTDSRAELLFHEVLHGEPITDPSITGDPSDLEVGLGNITTQNQVMLSFACKSPLIVENTRG
jgi:hypothetical protein